MKYLCLYRLRLSSQFEHEDSPSFIFTLPLCVIQVSSTFLSHYLGQKCYGIPKTWIWWQKSWKILFKAHFYIFSSISIPLQMWVSAVFLMKVSFRHRAGYCQSPPMKPLKARAGLSMFCASNQVFLEANVEASSAQPYWVTVKSKVATNLVEIWSKGEKSVSL